MTTATPAEIQRVITAALGDRAKLLRKDAASRRLAGPARAEMRALIRAEASLAEGLQRIVGHASPAKLASALEAQSISKPENQIVCSACLTEACFQGVLMCEDARRAGTVLARSEA